MVRCNLKTMSKPYVLWGEAVSYAVHILNRINTKALNESTPYEMWTGRKPQIGHLKVFGCLAHMMIPKSHLKKLEERSKPVVHLGIERGTKAYRLLDPDIRSIHIRRNVVFHEDQTWIWEKATKVQAIPGLTFTVEGFDFDDDQLVVERKTNEGDGEVSSTPDGQDPSYDMDWVGTDSQPTNRQLDPQSDQNECPLNSSLALNSRLTPNSPTSINSPVSTTNSSSTNSSSTGGGAPKRYRLLTDLYNATEQILMV